MGVSSVSFIFFCKLVIEKIPTQEIPRRLDLNTYIPDVYFNMLSTFFFSIEKTKFFANTIFKKI